MTDHYDQVHLADMGGVIQGPAKVRLGKSESLVPLTRVAEWLANKYGDRLKDEIRKPPDDVAS